jgi:hypothetical protein
MGLRTWSENREYPLQTDVTNSKNYLSDLELEDLNRLVGMVLDFFEDQTRRGWLVSMSDAWAKLEEILTVNKRKILRNFGSVRRDQAEAHAKNQYKIFDEARRQERKAAALAELNDATRNLRASKKKR